MRMPPPGERYIAASWIAVAIAVVTVLVGSVCLLLARHHLPSRIAVKWDRTLEAQTRVDLASALLIGASITVASCLVVLVIGVAIHRSVRHGLAGHAAGLTSMVGIGFYAMTVGQAWTLASEGQLLAVAGIPVGLWIGWRVSRWVRHPAPVVTPLLAAPASPELPTTARLMWSRTVPSPVVVRLSQAAIVALPLSLFYWWMGTELWFAVLLLAAVTIGRLLAVRRAQLTIDYSGVGLRGKMGNLPAPIRLGDVRSAEIITISALRDFGGWGKVTAPDGRQGWITRSGEALVVHRLHEPDFVYTVDDADEAATVLNTLVARYQSRDQTLTA